MKLSNITVKKNFDLKKEKILKSLDKPNEMWYNNNVIKREREEKR